MTKDQLASLAMSLRDNEAFQKALEAQRTRARDALVAIDAADTLGILRLQATVKVIDELREDLEQFIRAAAHKAPAGIA